MHGVLHMGVGLTEDGKCQWRAVGLRQAGESQPFEKHVWAVHLLGGWAGEAGWPRAAQVCQK